MNILTLVLLTVSLCSFAIGQRYSVSNYYLSATSKNWTEANRLCKIKIPAGTWYLTEVFTMEEFDFIKANFPLNSTTPEHWLGLQRKSNPSTNCNSSTSNIRNICCNLCADDLNNITVCKGCSDYISLFKWSNSTLDLWNNTLLKTQKGIFLNFGHSSTYGWEPNNHDNNNQENCITMSYRSIFDSTGIMDDRQCSLTSPLYLCENTTNNLANCKVNGTDYLLNLVDCTVVNGTWSGTFPPTIPPTIPPTPPPTNPPTPPPTNPPTLPPTLPPTDPPTPPPTTKYNNRTIVNDSIIILGDLSFQANSTIEFSNSGHIDVSG
eukprot:TRINITY_DN6506_c0_g1_i3.p1 TRINITY_DN6506_c0_g1~~TRINITY_DN6506_c0_g1_i3.p1  ORF type:complete len:321 (-),score=21.69 TRINITY_DN6506_c0_g1_i3:421-1383(-)